jgi:ketosteroid isomerase-like protein
MNNSGSDENAERAIHAVGQEVFTAIRLKDVATLRRVLAEDFVHRTPDGTEAGREEFLSGIAAMPVEVTSIGGEHLKVSVYGDVAVMTGVQRAQWRQGEAAEGVSSVAFTDVFALREGGWLMVLAFGVELQN